MIISAAKRSNMTAFPKIVTCGICVAIYEVLVYIITRKLDQNSEIVHVLKNTVPYFLAYSFIAAIPYFLKETKRLTKVLLGVACLALHYVMYFSFYSDIAINQVMSSRKFPPRMIYSLYAIGVSLILIELIKKRCKENKIMNTCCTFISKNSQWFYFNHIIMIYAWNMMFMNRFQQWWLMFIFVTFGATTLTLCMRKMADVVCEKSGAHITKIVKVIFG